MISGMTTREIEHRATDRGSGLQTGCVLNGFGCDESDDGELPALGEGRVVERTGKGYIDKKFSIG
jgi:hypothetical protein